MPRFFYVIVAFLLVAVILSFGYSGLGEAGSPGVTIEVNWVSYSTGFSYTIRLCSLGDYLYVVGSRGGPPDTMWVVEARSKVNGSLVKTWTFNPTNLTDAPLDCIAFDNKLYIVGYENLHPDPRIPSDSRWSIVVLDPNLNLLKYISYNPSPYGDSAEGITSDGQQLYVVGSIDFTVSKVQAGEEYYLVEIRDPVTLDVVKSLRLRGDVTKAGFNDVTGELWVVGFTRRSSNILVTIISRDLERFKTTMLPVEGLLCRGLAFDREGNAYISCKLGVSIAKLSSNGTLIKSTITYPLRPGVDFQGVSVGLYKDYVVLAGSKFDVDRKYKHAIRILDGNLTTVTEKILEPGLDYDNAYLEGMVLEGNKAYLVGLLEKGQSVIAVVVYSITINTQTAIEKTVTQTITVTSTTTITQTIVARETVTQTIIKTQEQTITRTQEKTVTYRETVTVEKTITTTEQQKPNLRNLLAGTIIGVIIGIATATPIILLTRKQKA